MPSEFSLLPPWKADVQTLINWAAAAGLWGEEPERFLPGYENIIRFYDTHWFRRHLSPSG